MKPVPHGEPYAGKLHVRFDEGAGVPDNKGRSALLYRKTVVLAIRPHAHEFYVLEEDIDPASGTLPRILGHFDY